ncbi:hypothetical protein [Arthrobacter sp. STN4]|uniref:hypothetical protein n=1 Tax=Arthrobacter sp. STN4 TaxID=2923276 RepID=UPI00211A1BAF|nr:hypothetical protein [Arthrobacter sp. STN4]MCQ9162993.1 hypothetical protein [Arthrobacter sp. STN4]
MAAGEQDEVLELEVLAVEAALGGLPSVVELLDHALPWLVTIGEQSPTARVEAIGAILVAHSEGPERLRRASEEWKAFLGPMRPWG